jgi:hypothetical protein
MKGWTTVFEVDISKTNIAAVKKFNKQASKTVAVIKRQSPSKLLLVNSDVSASLDIGGFDNVNLDLGAVNTSYLLSALKVFDTNAQRAVVLVDDSAKREMIIRRRNISFLMAGVNPIY